MIAAGPQGGLDRARSAAGSQNAATAFEVGYQRLWQAGIAVRNTVRGMGCGHSEAGANRESCQAVPHANFCDTQASGLPAELPEVTPPLLLEITHTECM